MGRPGARSQLLGFVIGLVPVLLSGVVVQHLPLSLRVDADRLSGWALFVAATVVVPGLLSASLESRWPHLARGIASAMVLIGCPLNVLILVGLLGIDFHG